jgi:hypothetical protein
VHRASVQLLLLLVNRGGQHHTIYNPSTYETENVAMGQRWEFR